MTSSIRRKTDRAGFYVEPTVIANVRQDDEVIQSEIFGPAITVQRFTGVARGRRGSGDSERCARGRWSASAPNWGLTRGERCVRRRGRGERTVLEGSGGRCALQSPVATALRPVASPWAASLRR